MRRRLRAEVDAPSGYWNRKQRQYALTLERSGKLRFARRATIVLSPSIYRSDGSLQMEVGDRIVFNVTHEYPKAEVMLFAEMLNRLRALDVVWDLTIKSHGHVSRDHHVDRAVEVLIYRDERGNHHNAVSSLTTWLRSNHVEYELSWTSSRGQRGSNAKGDRR